MELCARVASEHRVGVSYSTGKDSTVALDMVRRVCPGAPAAYFSSGRDTEFDQNFNLLRDHYPDVVVIESQQTLAGLCRRFGYWGCRAEVADDDVDFFAFLVGEPNYRFVTMFDLDVTTMGLRAAESSGRRVSASRRGQFYPIKYQYRAGEQHYHLTPISTWTDDDVWAYIAYRELPYNEMYDVFARLGIPRREWRISVLLGESASNIGRFSRLRQAAPDKFAELARQFPMIRRMT